MKQSGMAAGFGAMCLVYACGSDGDGPMGTSGEPSCFACHNDRWNSGSCR